MRTRSGPGEGGNRRRSATWNEIASMEFFDQAVGVKKPLRRVVCKICHEIVFDLKPGYDRGQMKGEIVHCKAHYAIWHDIEIGEVGDATS